MDNNPGLRMRLRVRWVAGGETVVITNVPTVESVIDLYRKGKLEGVASDPGEPLFYLACRPDQVAGLVAEAADESAAVVLGRPMVERARPALEALAAVLTNPAAAPLREVAAPLLAALGVPLPVLPVACTRCEAAHGPPDEHGGRTCPACGLYEVV